MCFTHLLNHSFCLLLFFNIIITAGCTGTPHQLFSFSKSTQEQRGVVYQDANLHWRSLQYRMLVIIVYTELQILITSSTPPAFLDMQTDYGKDKSITVVNTTINIQFIGKIFIRFANWQLTGTALPFNIGFLNLNFAYDALPAPISSRCPFSSMFGMGLQMNN